MEQHKQRRLVGKENSFQVPKWRRLAGSEVRSFLLVFGILLLMVAAILSTHFFTTRTIANLQQNTLDAAATFRMNGLLQDVVNQTNQLDFSIRKRLIQPTNTTISQSLADSVETVRTSFHSFYLAAAQMPGKAQNVRTFLHLMDQKMQKLDELMLIANGKQRMPEKRYLTATEQQLNDSIYTYALQLQSALEVNLFGTLQKGNQLSQQILNLSRVLSVMALLAFALLGTWLIKRLLQHDKLIRELKHSKGALENLARVKEEFLANMSHEIRTPLHAIKGYNDLLKQSVLTAQQEQQVTVMSHAVNLLLNVVNDILDYSKLEKGRLRIEESPIMLAQVCTDVLPLFEQSAKEKGLEFFSSIDPSLPDVVLGDAVRIQQILFNLVGNAIKFTDNGFVQLSITKGDYLKDNYINIQFEISDSGIGVDPAFHTAIFERFEQAPQQPNRKTTAGGTGLGLAIVQGLVRLMNGTISIESSIGKGACFKLNIPFCVLNKSTVAATATANDVIMHSANSFANAKVLVAEDNKANQKLLQFLFAQWQINWCLAENGMEVLNHLKQTRFDLILMDIQMPVMTGTEAIQVIRNELQLQVPVVALTANASLVDTANGNNKLFSDCLAKPFDQQQLLSILHKYLTDASSKSKVDIPQEVEDLPVELKKIVVPIFLKEFPLQLEMVENMIHQKAYTDAAQVAHTMIGTMAAMGGNKQAATLLRNFQDSLMPPYQQHNISTTWECFKKNALQTIAMARQWKDVMN